MRKYFWIAINGSCVALSPPNLPLAKNEFSVEPTPQIIIGFMTYAQASAAATLCLEADPSIVDRSVLTWMVMQPIIRPDVPAQSPTGKTAWIKKKATEAKSKVKKKSGWW